MKIEELEKLEFKLKPMVDDLEYLKYFKTYIIEDLDLVYKSIAKENNCMDKLNEIFSSVVNPQEVLYVQEIFKRYSNKNYYDDIFEIYFYSEIDNFIRKLQEEVNYINSQISRQNKLISIEF